MLSCNDYIILLLLKTIVWCRLIKHRFYKPYFNTVWFAQFIVSHLDNSYSIVYVSTRLTIICRLKKTYIIIINSYEIYVVITDIKIYYYLLIRFLCNWNIYSSYYYYLFTFLTVYLWLAINKFPKIVIIDD